MIAMDHAVEVVALPAETLLSPASNDFACEFCTRVYTRDQLLQRHRRRRHNLPPSERPRVYVCPEPGCRHHAPSRAFGDLTAVMKHFRRNHCEKEWRCDKCYRSYGLRADWVLHTNICGAPSSRLYQCVCGTIFSRRLNLIIHRGSCKVVTAEQRAMASGQDGVKAKMEDEPAQAEEITGNWTQVADYGVFKLWEYKKNG